MRLYRAWLYYQKERDFAGFKITQGVNTRKKWAEETIEYIRKNAPEKYLDFLIPKTEVGCKRRVNDTDCLACLHRDNVELVYNDPIEEIEEKGVRTVSGRFIHADAIVLAHGFETQKPLFPMQIYGKSGITINEHVSIPFLSPFYVTDQSVGPSQRRSSIVLFRNMSLPVPKPVHHDGPKHTERPSLGDLRNRVPNQFQPQSSAADTQRRCRHCRGHCRS